MDWYYGDIDYTSGSDAGDWDCENIKTSHL